MEMIDPSNSEKSDQIITWTSEELLRNLGHVNKFYRCSFCKRGFSNAQALGGHMNIHRRDRARLREFSCHDQNLLSLDINNSVNPPPRPAAIDDSLQREVSPSHDETIISTPSKRPCVTYEENDHLISKVNYDHNPLPSRLAFSSAHDVLLQPEVSSSHHEIIISSPSKRSCVTYEENDHLISKVNYDHNPLPPRPPSTLAHDVSLQREVASYNETITSSPSKRPYVTYDEKIDHLITSKVNFDHNHEVIIGDLLQLPLFKETPIIKEASNCVDEQVANKVMHLNPVSELDLELRLGIEPSESSTETDLRCEVNRF
ncbi:hypothetical protein HAX54_046834 [Datura stramonium]|uniref:C2H2-type domain-containing protein n=1 Tax=Datura stramonium TaxID=4076 RepID=A0ABS8SSA7_DATST|nr:hypothetical protein [Datura stramonium]